VDIKGFAKQVFHNFNHKLTSDEKKLVLFVVALAGLVFIGLLCSIVG